MRGFQLVRLGLLKARSDDSDIMLCLSDWCQANEPAAPAPVAVEAAPSPPRKKVKKARASLGSEPARQPAVAATVAVPSAKKVKRKSVG